MQKASEHLGQAYEQHQKRSSADVSPAAGYCVEREVCEQSDNK
jgi:hypothetical protein